MAENTTNIAQLSYANRDYQSIKTELLNKIPLVTSKWTDWNESDLGITLLELFTGLFDLMSYQLDRMTNESYLPTARIRTSVDNLTKLIDYHLAPSKGASVTEEITFGVAYPFNVTIPKGFKISTQDSKNKITYSAIADTIVIAGDTVVEITMSEGVRNEANYVSDGSANQSVTIPTNIQQPAGQDSYLEVTVDGVPWSEELTTLYGGTTAYLLDIGTDNNTVITFGDGVNGLIPANGANILIVYWTGNGISGRVGADTLTKTEDTLIQNTQTIILTATNPESSIGGENKESIEHAKYYAPKSLRRGNRLVTLEDYDTYASSYSIAGLGNVAIAKSYWKSSDLYACEMDLYVLSKDISGNYVVTSTALKTQLAADIDVQRCLCQKVNIIDGNINSIIVDMDVYVNSQYSPVTVAANVTDKINEYVTSLTFGGSLYVSKLIDLAMSVDGVYNAVVSSPTSNVTVSNTTVITLTDVVIRTL